MAMFNSYVTNCQRVNDDYKTNDWLHDHLIGMRLNHHLALGQNLIALVNIKIAGIYGCSPH